jgi:hypothetical protein
MLALVSAVAPAAILIILWQGGTNIPTPAQQVPQPSTVQAISNPTKAFPAIVLSSPDKLEVKAGDEIQFEIAVDSTEPLPARSIIAVSAMPEGAVFSEGRPYGITGWSLRPDEIGDLRLRLAKTKGAFDMQVELVAADGTRLAHSETRLKIADNPAEASQVTASAAGAEARYSAETFPPLPARKDTRAESPIRVATVKVVAIEPAPSIGPPHDGASSLGVAAEAPAEWVEIVSAVDMHAQPQQSSPTLKVAKKGVKLRLLARKKNWVQVSDPATSTKGWIYKRFLRTARPPA